MRLLQYADSALPIGSFSFSGGVESAAAAGLLATEEELEGYLHQSLRTAALTDGVAALHAYRAALVGNMEAVVEADQRLYCTKLWAESRAMSVRVGGRLLSLARNTLNNSLLDKFSETIAKGGCRGTQAVVLALIFAIEEVDEQSLWAALMSGVANMVLGASLRTTRLSHLTTQAILHRTAPLIEEQYATVLEMRLEDMQSFAPMMEIVAALHEQGRERLFMN